MRSTAVPGGPTLAWPGMMTRPRLIAPRIAMPRLGWDHRRAMREIAADADHRSLGVGAQLWRAGAEGCERGPGEGSAKLDRIIDQRFQVGAGGLAGERVGKDRGDCDTPQRGSG